MNTNDNYFSDEEVELETADSLPSEDEMDPEERAYINKLTLKSNSILDMNNDFLVKKKNKKTRQRNRKQKNVLDLSEFFKPEIEENNDKNKWQSKRLNNKNKEKNKVEYKFNPKMVPWNKRVIEKDNTIDKNYFPELGKSF